MRFGLTTRLLIATGALALIGVAAFAALLLAAADVNRARATVGNSQAELAQVREIRNQLLDMETGQRGFIITGQQRFLEPWEASRQRLPEDFARLRRIVDDPNQARRAEQLQRDALAYVNDYSLPLVDAARRGDPSVRGLAASDDGKQRMDALRGELNAYQTAEGSLIVAQQAKSDRAYIRGAVLAGAGLVAAIAVAALITAYLARGVVRPVRRTALMAERLAAGDLAARVPQTGGAEIGVLERAFNSMAESLQRNRDELSRLNDEQRALSRVARLVAHGRRSNEVYAAVAKEVGLLLNAEITRLLRFEADGGATVVAAWKRSGDPLPSGCRIAVDRTVAAPVRQTGTPMRITEQSPPELPEGSYSAVGTPIMVGGTLWGAMTALTPHDRPLAEGTEARMGEFTDLVGTAVANAQARADLVASRARIVATADESRRRIERDLHDGIQQRLVTLALRLRAVEVAVPAEAPELGEQLAAAGGGLLEAIDDLREVSRGIHPAILSEGGLVPALKALSRRSALPIETDLHVETRLSPYVEVAAYYVAAEALANAAKYANASVVRLSATVQDGWLSMTVRDDGVGGADPSRGSGLLGLTDRVEALGGTLTIVSPRGGGTLLHVELPVTGRRPDEV